METSIDLLMKARPVHSRVAIFTPTINAQAYVKVSVRMDKRIINQL